MPCFPTTSSSRKNRDMFIKICMVPFSANFSGYPDPQKSRLRIWLELSNSGENQKWTQQNIHYSCWFTIIPYYRSLSVPCWQCTESGLGTWLLNMGTESDWSWFRQYNLSVEHLQILYAHSELDRLSEDVQLDPVWTVPLFQTLRRQRTVCSYTSSEICSRCRSRVTSFTS